VDDALFFAFSDGSQRRAITSEGIILYFDKNQKFTVTGDNINFALLGVKILFDDFIPLLDEILFCNLFPPNSLLITFFAHDVGLAAILLPRSGSSKVTKIRQVGTKRNPLPSIITHRK